MAKNNNNLIEFVNNNFFWFVLIIIFFGLGFFSGSIWNNEQAGKVASVADTAPTLPNDAAPPQQETNYELTPAVTDADHIKGATNPKITLVEYSDFTCGFCGRVYPTLQQIVEDYPNDVAVVYRHYLLSPTGPARVVAQASECVANYEGNDQFWAFIGAYFTRSQQDSSLVQQENLLALAQELGMNSTQIASCIDNKEFDDVIDAQIAGGRLAGVAGTPATILITSDGEYDFISGAAPYESFQEKIEQYL